MTRVAQNICLIAMTNMGSGMMTKSMTNTLNQQNIITNRQFVTPSTSTQQQLFTSSTSLSTLPLKSSTPFKQRLSSGSSRATLPGALNSRRNIGSSSSLTSSRLTLSTAPSAFENIVVQQRQQR